MLDYTRQIIKTARKLLEEGAVDVFIGFQKGSLPLTHRPVLVKHPADADCLHWDSLCALNLCLYLTKRTDRIGVLATGCISRNIVTHIVENQIKREQLYIVGLPCRGMIDHRAVSRAVRDKEILELEEDGEKFTVRGRGFEKRLAKHDFLRSNCRECAHPNPVIYDELIGDPVEENFPAAVFKDVEKIEAMAAEKRRGFFSRLISRCLRCYACRNACPLCYCPSCFVDESTPQWVGKSVDPADVMTFHVLRAYHCAGRCTDCGACEFVCPVGIPVRQFTKKLNKDALKYFSWEAGLTLESRPPLDVYRPDDCNDFIR